MGNISLSTLTEQDIQRAKKLGLIKGVDYDVIDNEIHIKSFVLSEKGLKYFDGNLSKF